MATRCRACGEPTEQRHRLTCNACGSPQATMEDVPDICPCCHKEWEWDADTDTYRGSEELAAQAVDGVYLHVFRCDCEAKGIIAVLVLDGNGGEIYTKTMKVL